MGKRYVNVFEYRPHAHARCQGEVGSVCKWTYGDIISYPGLSPAAVKVQARKHARERGHTVTVDTVRAVTYVGEESKP